MSNKIAAKPSSRNTKQYIIWFLLIVAVAALEYKFSAVSSVLKEASLRDFKVKVEFK